MPQSRKRAVTASEQHEQLSDEPKANNLEGHSLKIIVKEALLDVLRDPQASGAAKASAGRTLMEFFSDDTHTAEGRNTREMSAFELDEEIGRLTKQKP